MKTPEQQKRDEDWSTMSGQVVGGESLPPAGYAPSWMCRIFGHKWWVTASNDRIDEHGLQHCDVTHRQMPYCDKCGIRNPSYGA